MCFTYRTEQYWPLFPLRIHCRSPSVNGSLHGIPEVLANRIGVAQRIVSGAAVLVSALRIRGLDRANRENVPHAAGFPAAVLDATR